MFKNYFRIALRKMMQQKMYSLINIGGLALGIACFLLISVYVNREMSYDKFHKNRENIYRVYRIENEPSGRVSAASTPHALPKALLNDYPGLENVVSILSTREEEIKANENVFQEKILFASPNFFDVFDFPFIAGSNAQLAKNINSIVLSKRLAKKLFGDLSPIGKTVTVHGQFEFIIAGVIENIPTNSSFQFDAFVSNEMVYRYIMPGEEQKWYSMGVETFVEFSASLSPEMLLAQLPGFLNKYLPDYLQGRLELELQPLGDIHTNTEIVSYTFPAVSKTMLLMFFLIACIILGIASMNFINLATARYTERQKEIGVRKVVGAHRWQLIQQFLGESILMTFCALILGYAMLQFLLPYFNKYVQQPLDLASFNNSSFLIFATGFGLMLGLINGLYPALLLSANKPVAILRKEQRKIFGHTQLRHLLVALQFAMTIALIFAVLCIARQISFMKHHDLGFLSENLIAIPTNTHPTEKADGQKISFFTEIIRSQGLSQGITSATFSENVPGSYFPNQFGVIPEGGAEDDRKEMVITRNVDEEFINTYQMDIEKGRNFSKTMVTDKSEAALINETAAKMFGWDEPVGKRFKFAFSSEFFTVVGVVRDFHFRSLQNKIEPLVFIQCWGNVNFVTVRVRSDDLQNSIAYLKQEWNKLLPGFPFKYHFVEDMYRESYREEEKLLQIVSTFAVFAIALAALGLLGLTALIAVQRTKEIGIRKVLEASVANIIFMLSKKMTFWIIVANIVALPVASYVINGWLQNFAYRGSISWWIFALSGGMALVIALLTASWQAIRAATANPVESLRYE
jgi:putative ABC transport system permease protein